METEAAVMDIPEVDVSVEEAEPEQSAVAEPATESTTEPQSEATGEDKEPTVSETWKAIKGQLKTLDPKTAAVVKRALWSMENNAKKYPDGVDKIAARAELVSRLADEAALADGVEPERIRIAPSTPAGHAFDPQEAPQVTISVGPP